MNNGEREIDQLFTEMEKEVTNLKTIHQRPLGALNFFKKSESFVIPLTQMAGVYIATFIITIEIETPIYTPPILQAGWDTPPQFYRIDFLDFSVSADYSTYTYKLRLIQQVSGTIQSVIFKAGATSSQPINSISAEVV